MKANINRILIIFYFCMRKKTNTLTMKPTLSLNNIQLSIYRLSNLDWKLFQDSFLEMLQGTYKNENISDSAKVKI